LETIRIYFERGTTDKKGVEEMKFCEKCDSRLKLKRDKNGETVIMTLQCDRCGTSIPVKKPITKSEVGPDEVQIKIVGEEVDVKTMPTLDIGCPKCKNREAYWWLLQTRSGDEATTQFYRCTKCNYTWREYA
jgi:DNA-directed RNA polymerase subunit M